MSISASQRARLGVFMIVGLVLMFIFIAIPVGIRLNNRTNVFYARFSGESLSGLEQGTVVKYLGVEIGKVTKISYDASDLTQVSVIMEIQQDFPMKTDMYAQTGMVGITGLKYVEILGGSNEAPLLKPGSDVKTVPSMMSNLTGKADVIVAKVELLLNHLTEITNPDSLKAIKQIVDNVAVITTDAREFMSAVSPELQTTTSSIRRIAQTADSVVTKVNSIASAVDKMFIEGDMKNILASVDSAATSTKHVTEDIALIIKQSREDIMISMENLREALENANELTKVLSENPSLLLRGDQQKERDLR